MIFLAKEKIVLMKMQIKENVPRIKIINNKEICLPLIEILLMIHTLITLSHRVAPHVIYWVGDNTPCNTNNRVSQRSAIGINETTNRININNNSTSKSC